MECISSGFSVASLETQEDTCLYLILLLRDTTAWAISAFHYTSNWARSVKKVSLAIPDSGGNDSRANRLLIAISKVSNCPLKLDSSLNEIVSHTCGTIRQVAWSVESFSLKAVMLFVRDARQREILSAHKIVFHWSIAYPKICESLYENATFT